ncbi:hypothetical protein JYU34_000515 [Plutella xylostella]|uniref:Uncharacterized protein n=1 Tax=Plutella xylostella TaxID=51655 RepID=A0ABQ7R813_PLUXY|nr:hypothetical protein JYU34_000515 [Plutella xylostella]
MAEPKLLDKLADVPIHKPGFETLSMSAPTIVQLNPEGKWESSKLGSLQRTQLQALVQHLVNSNAINAAQSYCCQCLDENKAPVGLKGTKYVPVIMMPLYSADNCPFDVVPDMEEKTETEIKVINRDSIESTGKNNSVTKKDAKKKGSKSPKKRPFHVQRLTDFDLMSQW